MANMQETEWEMELENEFEGTMESEFEHPEAGQQLEFEDEFETHETADEFESGQHEFETEDLVGRHGSCQLSAVQSFIRSVSVRSCRRRPNMRDSRPGLRSTFSTQDRS